MTIKVLFFISFLLSFAVFADPKIGYTPAPGLDLDSSWLDPGEVVAIGNYNSKLEVYEVVKIADPTLVKIYTTAENIVQAVPHLSLLVIKENPTAIVGSDYELEHELILLTSEELNLRKTKLENSSH